MPGIQDDMRQVKELTIENFRLGQRRDGALRNDALWSMYSLENFDIDYVEGSLKIRPGYEEWNTEELPAVPAQLYNFVDLENNSAVLGICGNRWYVLSEDSDHAMLIDEAATSPRPIITVDNRVIFATDSGIYWADYDSLTAVTPTCYRLGILRPDEPPTMVNTIAGIGQTEYGDAPTPVSAYGVTLMIVGDSLYRYVAGGFTLTQETAISDLSIRLTRPNTNTTEGNLRVAIYTENGGFPTTTLADENAISEWVGVGNVNVNTYDYLKFTLNKEITLSPGNYFIRLQGDGAYRNAFDVVSGAADQRFVAIDYRDPAIHPAKYTVSFYSADGIIWVTTGHEMRFYIGGLTDTYYYDYVITYANDAYGSESRPTDKIRIKYNAGYIIGMVNYPPPDDEQVDKIKLYRRTVGTDPLTLDADITDDYKFVGEIIPLVHPTVIYDSTGEDSLGAVLQTQDHYCYDEIDDDEGIFRDSEIIPLCMEFWKDRIWASKANDNRHYFTKILEEDGATGPANEASIDYFPLGNIQDIPASSSIIQIKRISQDQLATYYNDESIYIIFGANESLNPPGDIAFRDLMLTGGLFGTKGIDIATNANIIITREGLYRFGGTVSGSEYLSETNKSIIADVDNAHLDDCFPVVYGDEIYLFLDTDNDGMMETVLILDLSRDVPSRNIMDRSWRTYKWPFKASCAVVRKKGATSREMLVGDAEDNFIYRINTGTSDNSAKITGLLETHALKARNMVHIQGISIRSIYATSTIATYTVTGISSNTITDVQTFTPSSVNDIRGHNMGIRLPAHPDARLRVQMQGISGDELKLMIAHYIQE